MALLLVLGPTLLPECKDPDPGRLDLLCAAMSLAALLAVIYGLKQSVQDGVGWLPTLAVLVGLAIGVAFVVRQRGLAAPLIDLRLFSLPSFSGSLVVYTLSILVLFGAFFFMFQYLQLVKGLTPIVAGLWTLPSFVAFIVGSLLAPALVSRVRPVVVMRQSSQSPRSASGCSPSSTRARASSSWSPLRSSSRSGSHPSSR